MSVRLYKSKFLTSGIIYFTFKSYFKHDIYYHFISNL